MTAGRWHQPTTRGEAQLARFLVVGCLNFAVSFAAFYLFYRQVRLYGPLLDLLGPAGDAFGQLLERAGIGSPDAALANVLGYSAGVVNSFVWNKRWTFAAGNDTGRQFRRFLLLNLSLLILSSASLLVFTDWLGRSYKPVWLLTMSVVTLLNFAVSRSWVFGRAGRGTSAGGR